MESENLDSVILDPDEEVEIPKTPPASSGCGGGGRAALETDDRQDSGGDRKRKRSSKSTEELLHSYSYLIKYHIARENTKRELSCIAAMEDSIDALKATMEWNARSSPAMKEAFEFHCAAAIESLEKSLESSREKCEGFVEESNMLLETMKDFGVIMALAKEDVALLPLLKELGFAGEVVIFGATMSSEELKAYARARGGSVSVVEGGFGPQISIGYLTAVCRRLGLEACIAPDCDRRLQ